MRRALSLAVALLAALLAGCGGGEAPRTGSTLRATTVDRRGDGTLERGPGEPLRDRTELAPRSRAVRSLALFAQVSDAHVRDEESPARVPFLDRLGPPFDSTFRPQEALTDQVLAAAVRSIDALRPQAVIESGDLIDNDQANELAQATDVLRGGRVDPDSGAPGYRGVQAAGDPDPFYYRPDVDAPRHPHLLADAERPFRSPGLRAPWYPVLGNHDVLVQGEVPPTPATRAAAVGSRAVVGLDPGLSVPSGERAFDPRTIDRLLRRGFPGRSIRTPADPRRRELSAPAVLGRLRSASGHGGRRPRLDYAFDIGPSLRTIVLDTVRRGGGAEGIVEPAELGFLRRQLAAAGRRWVVVVTHQPLATCAGGERALALLDRDPRVVAALSGHTHRNRIVPRHSPAGGYWLITTASLIDYPQQARALRLVQTADGGVAIETWMLDPTPDGGLADVARQLAYLDVQGGRPNHLSGARIDRNVRLYLPPRR